MYTSVAREFDAGVNRSATSMLLLRQQHNSSAPTHNEMIQDSDRSKLPAMFMENREPLDNGLNGGIFDRSFVVDLSNKRPSNSNMMQHPPHPTCCSIKMSTVSSSTNTTAASSIPQQLPPPLLMRSNPIPSKPLAYCTPNPVPNLPENNQVHLVHYRGAQLAAFNVDGRDLVCLPQAFELFLKHLVGGLHTVYTKLKRLEIVPVVCNVEQVRILRGLGAIQPGVNRCKLIAPHEFDVLYADCTNSSARPGRPSKRIASLNTNCSTPNTITQTNHSSCNSTNLRNSPPTNATSIFHNHFPNRSTTEPSPPKLARTELENAMEKTSPWLPSSMFPLMGLPFPPTMSPSNGGYKSADLFQRFKVHDWPLGANRRISSSPSNDSSMLPVELPHLNGILSPQMNGSTVRESPVVSSPLNKMYNNLPDSRIESTQEKTFGKDSDNLPSSPSPTTKKLQEFNRASGRSLQCPNLFQLANLLSPLPALHCSPYDPSSLEYGEFGSLMNLKTNLFNPSLNNNLHKQPVYDVDADKQPTTKEHVPFINFPTTTTQHQNSSNQSGVDKLISFDDTPNTLSLSDMHEKIRFENAKRQSTIFSGVSDAEETVSRLTQVTPLNCSNVENQSFLPSTKQSANAPKSDPLTPSYFDTVFQHLLHVYRQWPHSKSVSAILDRSISINDPNTTTVSDKTGSGKDGGTDALSSLVQDDASTTAWPSLTVESTFFESEQTVCSPIVDTKSMNDATSLQVKDLDQFPTKTLDNKIPQPFTNGQSTLTTRQSDRTCMQNSQNELTDPPIAPFKVTNALNYYCWLQMMATSFMYTNEMSLQSDTTNVTIPTSVCTSMKSSLE